MTPSPTQFDSPLVKLVHSRFEGVPMLERVRACRYRRRKPKHEETSEKPSVDVENGVSQENPLSTL